MKNSISRWLSFPPGTVRDMIDAKPFDHRRIKALDGLRGWGALIVVLYHTFVQISPPTPDVGAALYRVFAFNGPIAVWAFFIVSGFSLSIGFLDTGNRLGRAKLLAGRYFRLMVPIMLACILYWLSSNTGLIQEPFLRENTISLWPILRFAMFDVFFEHDPLKSPIPPLWTMPIEITGSIVVISLLLLCGKTKWRFAAYAILGSLCFSSYPGLVAFLIGVVLAEQRSGQSRGRFNQMLSHVATVMIAPALLAPSFWPFPWTQGRLLVSAAFISASILCSERGRRFLSTRLSQFLGGVSFPLYLLHTLVIYSFGSAMMRFAGSSATILVVDIVTVGVAILVATIFAFIDRAGIAVSKRVSGALCVALPLKFPVHSKMIVEDLAGDRVCRQSRSAVARASRRSAKG